MSVSLRIVGIYYHQDDIPYTSGMTVRDVLDYARLNPVNSPEVPANLFGYTESKLIIGRDAGKPSVSAFFANYTAPIKSITSGIIRPKGQYYLEEKLAGLPSFTSWQYYVFDKPLQSGDAVYQPNSPRIESFADAVVPDGGFVTWRLVEILETPNPIPLRRMNIAGLREVREKVHGDG